MMQQHEQRAVAAIQKHRSVLENTVRDYNGEIIEYFGDGSLCIFSTATEAVRFATHVQQQMNVDPAVPLRIGLHLGEIFFDDKRVMGDGVNLASRIQSLGQAGSILFSKEIADQIRNHEEFRTQSLGFFSLKNVAQPMEIFALANEGLTVQKKEEMAGRWLPPPNKISLRFKLTLALLTALLALIVIFSFYRFYRKRHFTGNDKSIAVLPFENISNDSSQEYFSDGITEEIISQLSKIADLKVISRTSVMAYKNSQKNVRQIARELGVSSILEGSVRREGDNIRITAQFIDADRDQHLWAENYDRKATEIFAIQSEVARRIANELNATLTAEETKRIGKKATTNVGAYEDYLRAKQLPMQQAEPLLLIALRKDSTFAAAWAQLAYTYSKMPKRTPTDGPFYIRKSLDAALKAVEYGPELSESHMILGDVLKTITLNPGLSIKELNKSITLNPNNADAYVFLAFALMELGQFDKVESNLVKAEQLAPLSAMTKFARVRLYTYSRNPEKLAGMGKEIKGSIPASIGNYGKAWYYFLKDQYDSVIVYAREPALVGLAYAQLKNTGAARKVLDSLKTNSQNDNALSIGIIYAWLGEKEKAMDYLNLAYRLYDYELISIKVNKLFDPLRNEKGFKELLVKMGML
ncbi:MAG: Guanylate cyclase [Segetibacter sp.]|nr:Guanylate cyclase [Segetibacter sp.]